MKMLLKQALRRAAARAPWGARFALLDGCIDGMDFADVAARVLPRLGFAEVVASGDRGMITSRSSDNIVIQEYARTGSFAPVLTEAISAFFAQHGGGDVCRHRREYRSDDDPVRPRPTDPLHRI